MEKLLVKTAIHEYKTDVIETFAKDSVKFIGRTIGEIASEGDLSTGLENVGKQIVLQSVEESAVEVAEETSADVAKEIVAEAVLEEANTLLNVGVGLGVAAVIFSAAQAYKQYDFNKNLSKGEIEQAKKRESFSKKNQYNWSSLEGTSEYSAQTKIDLVSMMNFNDESFRVHMFKTYIKQLEDGLIMMMKSYNNRKRIKHQIKVKHYKEEKAATNIQRIFRGRQSRKDGGDPFLKPKKIKEVNFDTFKVEFYDGKNENIQVGGENMFNKTLGFDSNSNIKKKKRKMEFLGELFKTTSITTTSVAVIAITGSAISAAPFVLGAAVISGGLFMLYEKKKKKEIGLDIEKVNNELFDELNQMLGETSSLFDDEEIIDTNNENDKKFVNSFFKSMETQKGQEIIRKKIFDTLKLYEVIINFQDVSNCHSIHNNNNINSRYNEKFAYDKIHSFKLSFWNQDKELKEINFDDLKSNQRSLNDLLYSSEIVEYLPQSIYFKGNFENIKEEEETQDDIDEKIKTKIKNLFTDIGNFEIHHNGVDEIEINGLFKKGDEIIINDLKTFIDNLYENSNIEWDENFEYNYELFIENEEKQYKFKRHPKNDIHHGIKLHILDETSKKFKTSEKFEILSINAINYFINNLEDESGNHIKTGSIPKIKISIKNSISSIKCDDIENEFIDLIPHKNPENNQKIKLINRINIESDKKENFMPFYYLDLNDNFKDDFFNYSTDVEDLFKDCFKEIEIYSGKTIDINHRSYIYEDIFLEIFKKLCKVKYFPINKIKGFDIDTKILALDGVSQMLSFRMLANMLQNKKTDVEKTIRVLQHAPEIISSLIDVDVLSDMESEDVEELADTLMSHFKSHSFTEDDDQSTNDILIKINDLLNTILDNNGKSFTIFEISNEIMDVSITEHLSHPTEMLAKQNNDKILNRYLKKFSHNFDHKVVYNKDTPSFNNLLPLMDLMISEKYKNIESELTNEELKIDDNLTKEQFEKYFFNSNSTLNILSLNDCSNYQFNLINDYNKYFNYLDSSDSSDNIYLAVPTYGKKLNIQYFFSLQKIFLNEINGDSIIEKKIDLGKKLLISIFNNCINPDIESSDNKFIDLLNDDKSEILKSVERNIGKADLYVPMRIIKFFMDNFYEKNAEFNNKYYELLRKIKKLNFDEREVFTELGMGGGGNEEGKPEEESVKNTQGNPMPRKQSVLTKKFQNAVGTIIRSNKKKDTLVKSLSKFVLDNNPKLIKKINELEKNYMNDINFKLSENTKEFKITTNRDYLKKFFLIRIIEEFINKSAAGTGEIQRLNDIKLNYEKLLKTYFVYISDTHYIVLNNKKVILIKIIEENNNLIFKSCQNKNANTRDSKREILINNLDIDEVHGGITIKEKCDGEEEEEEKDIVYNIRNIRNIRNITFEEDKNPFNKYKKLLEIDLSEFISETWIDQVAVEYNKFQDSFKDKYMVEYYDNSNQRYINVLKSEIEHDIKRFKPLETEIITQIKNDFKDPGKNFNIQNNLKLLNKTINLKNDLQYLKELNESDRKFLTENYSEFFDNYNNYIDCQKKINNLLNIVYLNIYKVLDNSDYSEKINLFLEIHKHFEIVKSSYGSVGEKQIEDLFIEGLSILNISDIEGEMKTKFIEIINGEAEERLKKIKEEEDRLRKEKEAEELKKAEKKLDRLDNLAKARENLEVYDQEDPYHNFKKGDIFHLIGERNNGWADAIKISDRNQEIKLIPIKWFDTNNIFVKARENLEVYDQKDHYHNFKKDDIFHLIAVRKNDWADAIKISDRKLGIKLIPINWFDTNINNFASTDPSLKHGMGGSYKRKNKRTNKKRKNNKNKLTNKRENKRKNKRSNKKTNKNKLSNRRKKNKNTNKKLKKTNKRKNYKWNKRSQKR